jgi:hypothetical protein
MWHAIDVDTYVIAPVKDTHRHTKLKDGKDSSQYRAGTLEKKTIQNGGQSYQFYTSASAGSSLGTELLPSSTIIMNIDVRGKDNFHATSPITVLEGWL